MSFACISLEGEASLWPGCSLALLAGSCHDSSSRELADRSLFEVVSVLCSGSVSQMSLAGTTDLLESTEGASLIARH